MVNMVETSVNNVKQEFMSNQEKQAKKKEKIKTNYDNLIKKNGHEVSSWIWNSPESLDGDKISELLDFADNENISTIYLNISDYIDIDEMKDDENKINKLNKFKGSLKLFLSVAHQKNMKVHALGGDSEWALSSHHYIPLKLLDFVISFNKENEDNLRFDGIQFDIEPHNLKDFNVNKKVILNDYLDLCNSLSQNIIETLSNNEIFKDFQMGFVVPYWFDNENGNCPPVVWQEKEAKLVVFTLLDVLNRVKNGYLVVLSYRNVADGKDGSIIHAKTEIDYAQDSAKNVSVIIGQETTKVEPSKITFYGEERMGFKEEVLKIFDFFKDKEVFRGIGIHDIYGYKDFKE